MPPPVYCVLVEAAGTVGDDRVGVIETGAGLLIAVADGAGGIRGSAHSAAAVVRELASLVERGLTLDDETVWTAFLTQVDRSIEREGCWGQTTAVVLAVTDRWVCGASVGDSEAWLATPDHFRHLTVSQNRKPFLGSGRSRPVSFRRSHGGGALVVSTDGLFKNVPAWRICEVAVGHDPEEACPILLDLARLPDGRLRDDVAVAVVHLGPAQEDGTDHN